MTSHRLDEMTKGWFVGPFTPTALSTDACEAAVKRYAAGESEADHFHKVATEVTVVVEGTVRMAGREWTAGDVIVLEPGEPTAFAAVTDALTVVVKLPGVLGDKYLV